MVGLDDRDRNSDSGRDWSDYFRRKMTPTHIEGESLKEVWSMTTEDVAKLGEANVE